MKKHLSSVTDQLQVLLKQYNLENKYVEFEIKNNWSRLIPKQIANISQPEKVEDNVLYLRVNDEQWKKEIQSRKQEVLALVNRTLKQIKIKKIKLV